MLVYDCARFSWIPGSEPIHLDLEKLFLLLDLMESLNLYGRNKISEIEKKHRNKNILGNVLKTVRNELSVAESDVVVDKVFTALSPNLKSRVGKSLVQRIENETYLPQDTVRPGR